jgi:hypothetical protein
MVNRHYNVGSKSNVSKGESSDRGIGYIVLVAISSRRGLVGKATREGLCGYETS